MKRWIIFVLFSILLSYPAVSGAADDTFDTGKSTMFGYQFLKFPIGAGANPDSNAAKDDKGEGEAQKARDKEKQILDKKVDDAIKKAWEEK